MTTRSTDPRRSARRGSTDASDAEAVDWFKTTHPAEFARGAEMRVFDQ